MKKTLAVFLIFVLFLAASKNTQAVSPGDAPQISAQCSILMEAETGTVLAENNADAQMLIASTTKIMTALVVIEHCNLNETLKVKREYTQVEGSSMYLREGEMLRLGDVLYGLMLCSGNDAAVALACHTAGSIEKFAKLMNEKAAELGMTNSSFQNPHGLDTDRHHSTARDMAILTVSAMQNKEFADIVSTKTISVAGRSLKNHNKLLWMYDGARGVKTGFTKSAGRSLVSCAERDGMRLVCVTLNDPNDWDDHSTLYNFGFDNYKYVSPVQAGETVATIPVICGTAPEVGIVADASCKLLTDKSDEIRSVVNAPDFVYGGFAKGDSAGEMKVYSGDEEIQSIPLHYGNDVALDQSQKLSLGEKIKWGWNHAVKNGLLRFGYYG